jgi:hypothetical protein
LEGTSGAAIRHVVRPNYVRRNRYEFAQFVPCAVTSRHPQVQTTRIHLRSAGPKKKTPAPEGARVCRRMGEGLGAGGHATRR